MYTYDDAMVDRLTDIVNVLEAERGDTYEGMADDGVLDADDLFCPLTRKPCMGRMCAAAEPLGLHGWRCTAWPSRRTVEDDRA